jgi:hypothetical protein
MGRPRNEKRKKEYRLKLSFRNKGKRMTRLERKLWPISRMRFPVFPVHHPLI